jgi:hypothetical protein
MLLFLFAVGMTASSSDLQVGNVSFSSTDWGKQKAWVNLTDSSGDYKFVVARIEVNFPPGIISPKRISRSAFILEPLTTTRIEIPFEIPCNFDTGFIQFDLYNVVDTLDTLLESQNFFSHKYAAVHALPEGLKMLLPEKIEVPAFVDKNISFDNYFTRAFFVLLHQGKSLDEISRLSGADPVYIKNLAAQLQSWQYIKQDSSGPKPAFAVIDKSTIDKLRPMIDRVVEDLYKAISLNLPRYDSTLEALASSGKLTRDKYNLFDGGSILYHKYPVILVLFLWDKLGRDFVNDGVEFNIFANSNLCNAIMPEYMYLVGADKGNAGRSFYYYQKDPDGERIYCADSEVAVNCTLRTGTTADGHALYEWSFSENSPSTYFSYNVDKVSPGLSVLAQGTGTSVADLKAEITKMFSGPPYGTYFRGARYWCWNLIVTELLDKLTKGNLLTREESGFYILNKVTD